MFEWNIQSRAHQCQLTGKTFVAGAPFHTVLLDAKVGFERLDLCPSAWKEHGAEINQRPNYVSHWVGVYEAPPAVIPDAIKRDDAEALLRALIERKEERYVPTMFILAVMLERKKALRVKTQLREGGRRVIVYEHVKTGDVILIQDPDLQLAQLETVQHDVAYLLENGLPQKGLPQEVVSYEGMPNEEPFNAPSEIATLALA